MTIRASKPTKKAKKRKACEDAPSLEECTWGWCEKANKIPRTRRSCPGCWLAVCSACADEHVCPSYEEDGGY